MCNKNLFQANSIITNDNDFSKGKILDGIRYALKEYKQYIEKSIKVVQDQGAIKVNLKKEVKSSNFDKSKNKSKSQEKSKIRYYLQLEGLGYKKVQKIESELFERDARVVYSEQPNGDRNKNKSLEIKIINRNEEKKYLTLDTEEDLEYVFLKANDYQLKMQWRAVQNLIYQPKPEHTALQKLFDLSYKAEEYYNNNYELLSESPNWEILTDKKRDGNKEQQDFVKKAMQTKDFALLEGPPGSGKTTAIIELIIQLIKQGKRVLLVSATHVAVDNVIHRVLTTYKKQCEGLVVPLRISYDVGSIRKKSVEPYRLQTLVSKTKQSIKNNISNDLGKESKEMLYKSLSNDKDKSIDDIILKSANLVCGTMIGILQHPDIKKGGIQEMFDVMIVDEASKVTFLDFIVPALYAKKWILVGDVKQLSPYTEDDIISENIDGVIKDKRLKKELIENFEKRKGYNKKGNNQQEWKDRVGSILSQMYQYRFDERFYKEIYEDYKLLVPKEYREGVEKIRRIALPSILELLQIGMGETKRTAKNGNVYTEQKLIYEGFRQFPNIISKKFQTLTYQHRMHDDIAKIPRKYFYNNENLKTSNKVLNREDILRNYKRNEAKVIWNTNQDKSFKKRNKNGRTKNINPTECHHIRQELWSFVEFAKNNSKKNNEPYELAILTFYREQEFELKKMLQELTKQSKKSKYFKIFNVNITLSTVDKFQGDEADIVLLSFTKFTKKAFYNSPNRLNVALTRARYKLVLFGNQSWFQKNAESKGLKGLASDFDKRISINSKI